MQQHLSIALTLLAIFLIQRQGIAQPVTDKHVTAELIAQSRSIQPGQPLYIGVRLVMEEGWHTYWKNPGDAGLATTIEWDLPEGFVAGPILWPAPSQFGEAPEISYGYHHEILLPVQITPAATLRPGDTLTLRARADWLACNQQCLKGKAALELRLPVGTSAKGSWDDLFRTTLEQLPTVATRWGIDARRIDKGYRIDFSSRMRSWQPLPTSAVFFPSEAEVIDHSAPQQVTRESGDLILTLTDSPFAPKPANRLDGVLVIEFAETKEREAFAIDLSVEGMEESRK